MKPNTFSVAVIVFAATTAIIGTAIASLLPTLAPTQVWVRRIETVAPTAPNKLNLYAGTHNLTTTASGIDVIVSVDDTTTPGNSDTRKGRYSNDVIITTANPVLIIYIPLPIVP
jgi:hypothetical protein